MGHGAVVQLLQAQGFAGQDGQGRDATARADLSGAQLFSQDVSHFRCRRRLETTLPAMLDRGASVEEVGTVAESAAFLSDVAFVR